MKSLIEKMYSSLWLFCHGYRLKKGPAGKSMFFKRIDAINWYRMPALFAIREHKALMLRIKEKRAL